MCSRRSSIPTVKTGALTFNKYNKTIDLTKFVKAILALAVSISFRKQYFETISNSGLTEVLNVVYEEY